MPDQILTKQIIFHEAGHAAAIYLYNKQKNALGAHYVDRKCELFFDG